MRVLVSTTAGTGHFGPLIPFARACSAAGHDVAVAAPASFADQVQTAGFEHRAFADAPAEQMGAVFARLPTVSFEEANRIIVSEVFGRLDAQAGLPGLVETIETWRPDVVLREPSEFASLVAARAADVPQMEVAIGVSAMSELMVPLVEQPLAELDALAGLPDGAAADAMQSTPILTSVPSVLDDALGGGADRSALHRFHDASLSPQQGKLPEAWGDPSHPLVYATFGSVAAELGPFARVYPELVAAFAGQPVRVLLTTGAGLDPDTLGPRPDNVRVERWWPQNEVMPHCAAMAGHGGFGTTMTALAAGVPQVVVPLFAYDQRLNADHVAAVGAGLRVDGGAEAMADVPEAVERVMRDSSYRAAARSVADEMSSLPPLAEAVTLLERHAAR
jgi:UDP:flavonoid glycosyltransferase YjiC (YdhE family)